MKENLRPEFLNRIDEAIMFLPLTKAEVRQILLLLLKKTDKMLQRQGLSIQLTEAAIDLLGDEGYDPQFGARPMKRALQDILIDELSKHVIASDFVAGDTVYVDAGNEELTFSKNPLEGAKPVGSLLADRQVSSPKSAPHTPQSSARSRRRGKGGKPGEREQQFKDLEKAVEDVQDGKKKG